MKRRSTTPSSRSTPTTTSVFSTASRRRSPSLRSTYAWRKLQRSGPVSSTRSMYATRTATSFPMKLRSSRCVRRYSLASLARVRGMAADEFTVSASDLLRWSEALSGIARTGLGFTQRLYEQERFEEVLRVAGVIRGAYLEEGEGDAMYDGL